MSGKHKSKEEMIKLINKDTIRLLSECNAGVKMAVTSIDDVIEYVEDKKLKGLLEQSKKDHEDLGNQTHELLNKYHDEGKEPNPMAKVMSWMKINMKLMQEPKDPIVADLIVDGCNMGVKSLSKYLNQYAAADEDSKNITKDLISIEEKFSKELRDYL